MSPIVKPPSSRSSTSVKGNYNAIALGIGPSLPSSYLWPVKGINLSIELAACFWYDASSSRNMPSRVVEGRARWTFMPYSIKSLTCSGVVSA